MIRAPASPAENNETAPPAGSPETLRLLAQRRSPKPFFLAEPGPTREQMEDLLRLAARVPDHGKLAPWRFIVFAGDARARAGAAMAAAARAEGGHSDESLKAIEQTLTHAPAVVAVVSRAAPHPKIPEWEQILSAGAVCFNFMVASTAMGFGAVWLTGWPAYHHGAQAALGLQPSERLAALIHVGAQTTTQPERVRPDLSAIVSWY